MQIILDNISVKRKVFFLSIFLDLDIYAPQLKSFLIYT